MQTLDFFPPIVDDPRWFGRIAAANSIGDVYAMGGTPVTAMNIVGWPQELDIEILGEILAGGMDKIRESGAVLCGGHSVVDTEIKYGLSVTGLVHPERFWRNSGAREGDHLVLTKPLGMGAVSTAIKKGKVDDATARRACEQMASLHRRSVEAVADLEIHGATDVTGFGFMGHAGEMASGARLTLRVRASHVPVFDGALALARQGVLSGGAARGRKSLASRVQVSDGLEEAVVNLLFDAETSGGLLLAVPEDAVERLCRRLEDAGALCHAVVGRFTAREQYDIVVE